MKTILFTGGGSAGHVIPNLALIPQLRENTNIIYAGTDGIERDLLKNTGIPFYTFTAPKLVRGSILKNLLLPFRAAKSLRQARHILRQTKPDLIFSKGGYVSLPIVLQANHQNIPVVSHESDFSTGLANKIIAKRCKTVLTSFPETAKSLPNGKFCGSPIRNELFCSDRSAALKKYGFSGEKPVLLIFGGGSGSKAINDAVEQILPKLCAVFDIIHIRGSQCKTTRFSGYVPLKFERDMASAYACSDYVVSRAGSNTVFEILALKKPALLIPLDNGRSRGDQIQNAEYFRKRGLVHVLPEHNLTPQHLYDALTSLQNDRDICIRLSHSPFRSGNTEILKEINHFLAI